MDLSIYRFLGQETNHLLAVSLVHTDYYQLLMQSPNFKPNGNIKKKGIKYKCTQKCHQTNNLRIFIHLQHETSAMKNLLRESALAKNACQSDNTI